MCQRLAPSAAALISEWEGAFQAQLAVFDGRFFESNLYPNNCPNLRRQGSPLNGIHIVAQVTQFHQFANCLDASELVITAAATAAAADVLAVASSTGVIHLFDRSDCPCYCFFHAIICFATRI